jgi:hypothetical protein
LKKVIENTDWNLVFVIILPIFFILAVKFSVEHIHHSLCLFKFFTGHECLGCGMTRALNSLINLNFSQAYSYNPRVIIVAPLLFIAWLQTLFIAVKRRKYHKNVI